MKQLFTLLIALFLLPLISYADDSGTCGDGLTYTYEASTQTLTITGNGAMSNYGYSDTPWYAYRNKIKNIIIAEGATSIGNCAFYGCSGLISITIPEGVTSIGNVAFALCSGLSSITIPNSVTSIGSRAFDRCRNLPFVSIGDGVTSIGSDAFRDCSSISRVELNSNAIVSQAYSYSSSLNNIFGSQVKEYILGDKVKSIGNYAFYGCSGLTSITISNSVTYIGNAAFAGCSGLTSITIPEGVTSIREGVFHGCSGLTSITIPEGVASIGRSAFENCASLTSINIPNSVTRIENAFAGCCSLTRADFKSLERLCYISFSSLESNPLYYTNNLYINGQEMKAVTIPESVKSIGNYAFAGCSGLESIEIPSSVTSINSYAFRDCSGLTSIEIPSSVTSISSTAFYGCIGLTSIRVAEENPKYDSRNNCNAIIEASTNTLRVGINNTIIPESVTSIGDYAFYGSGLTSIEIPSTVISIGRYSFSDCKSLTSIEIPSSITSITSYAFMSSGLISITLPQSLLIIDGGAFEDCINLTSINIPDGVTSFPYQYNPFKGCNSLKSITIGSGLTLTDISCFMGLPNIEEISVAAGNRLFDSRENCNAVIETATNTLVLGSSKTIIPESVTTIGGDAFSNNKNLKSITIPKYITYISESFSGCPLENIIAMNSKTRLYDKSFSDATFNHAILYVPTDKRWEAIYDGGWWRFNNIREMAMAVDELLQTKAYSLMNLDDFSVSVYDAVNDRVASIGSLYDVDENNAANGWQIIMQGSKQYLYNIGARLYASPTSTGTFTLSQTPISVNIRKGKDGLILDDSNRQWGFVLNERLQPEDNPTGIERVVDDSTSPSEIFTIDGRRVGQLQRGLNIVIVGNKSVKVVK